MWRPKLHRSCEMSCRMDFEARAVLVGHTAGLVQSGTGQGWGAGSPHGGDGGGLAVGSQNPGLEGLHAVVQTASVGGVLRLARLGALGVGGHPEARRKFGLGGQKVDSHILHWGQELAPLLTCCGQGCTTALSLPDFGVHARQIHDGGGPTDCVGPFIWQSPTGPHCMSSKRTSKRASTR